MFMLMRYMNHLTSHQKPMTSHQKKNDVIVLLTTMYFVRIITTVKVTITCVKLGYIFTVVTLIHVK